MKFQRVLSCFVCTGLLATTACTSTPPAAAPVVVYGSVALAGSSTAGSGKVDLTSVVTCTRNADTGRVDVTLSAGGDNSPTLSLAIKNYSTSTSTYTCTQATDNTGESAPDIGGKFASCMVAASLPSAPSAATLDAYAMYRDDPATKKFKYSGTCAIQVTSATAPFKGTVNCGKMIQTVLEGAPRNPIDEKATGDVVADFSCTF